MKYNRLSPLLASALPMLIATVPAYSQDESAILEQVVVTAEKRKTSLEDTPIAISAFSGDALATAGVRSASDLAGQVPNLAFSSRNNEVIVNIRGIQSNSVNEVGDPAVALHLDGAYLSRARGAGALFFDIERVEVLRGPQGTLYGRNATAGNINIVTNKPVNEFKASAEVVAGNYDRQGARGMINVPVVDDKFLLRASFVTDQHDGYNTNNRVVRGIRNTDDADDTAFRLHALFTPTDDLSILLSGRYQENDSVGPGMPFLRFLDPSNPRVFDLNMQPEFNSDVTGASAEVNWDFSDDLTLTYVGSWTADNVNERLQDLDLTTSPFGYPEAVATFGPFEQHTDVITHELRLASDDTGRVNWLFGLFYFDEQQDADFHLVYQPGVREQRFNQFDVQSQSKAAFGQLNFRLTDQVEFVVGARYTEDEKSRLGVNQTILQGVVTTSTPNINAVDSSKANYRGGINWRPYDGALYYAQVSTGYKGGGFNNGVGPDSSYAPEEVTSYEIGSKQTLLDGTLQLNAAAFYMDYSDLQVTVISTVNGLPGSFTRNAAKAVPWGFELEGQALITSAARINFGLGYLSAEYDEYNTDDPAVAGTLIEDLSGNKMIKSPEWTFNIGAEYRFELGFGSLTPRLQFSYEDEVFLREFNKATDVQDSFTKTDFILSYRDRDERFYVEAFVRNIEDEDVRMIMSSLPGHGLAVGYNPPRTYGARVGFSF